MKQQEVIIQQKPKPREESLVLDEVTTKKEPMVIEGVAFFEKAKVVHFEVALDALTDEPQVTCNNQLVVSTQSTPTMDDRHRERQLQANSLTVANQPQIPRLSVVDIQALVDQSIQAQDVALCAQMDQSLKAQNIVVQVHLINKDNTQMDACNLCMMLLVLNSYISYQCMYLCYKRDKICEINIFLLFLKK